MIKIVYLIPFILLTLLCSNVGKAIRLTAGSGNVSRFFLYLVRAYNDFFISVHPVDLLIGAAISAAVIGIIYYRQKNKLPTMDGKEYGTAHWGTAKDIKPFIDKDFSKNMILTQTERLMTNDRPKDWKLQRNKNLRVQGSSGAGKTRYVMKPNILQMTDSYVVVDSKGTVCPETGHAFEVNDYNIRIFNTINFKKSMHYNPFEYINPDSPEADILSFSNLLIENTNGDKPQPGTEDFWVKAERLLYNALISYLYFYAPAEENNLPTLIDLLDYMCVKEADEDYMSPVDHIFEDLKEKQPDCFAVKQYVKFKMAAGKTAKSILISCGARLAVFDIKEIREITMYDELSLDTLGDQKSILYLIMSDNDPTFNFLNAIAITQMFRTLIKKADDEYGGRLPIAVRVHVDEFYNVGTIPHFDKLIGTIRSRNISATIYLQSDAQLSAKYDKIAPVVADNFDSFLYLGGAGDETKSKISKALGKRTVISTDISESYGTQKSRSVSKKKIGVDLMSVNELSEMPRDKCIYFLNGCPPFYSTKYDLTKHPNYKLTGDYDKRFIFDIKKYIKRKGYLELKEDDEFEIFDMTKE